jgi:malonate transporter and related proteins
MLNTILGALLPMVVTFLLGLLAAWHHDFGPQEASILNRMVLFYAVALALFAGTVTSSRAELSQDVPLVIALCVATIGFYGAVFLLAATVSSGWHGRTARTPNTPRSHQT